MPTIIIQQTVIDFPDTAASPEWSEGIIAFAKAVEEALNTVIGKADISPQIMTIDAYNSASNINVVNLSFSPNTVRGAFIRYTVYRTTDSSTAYEAGSITAVYNTNGTTGSKWEMIQGPVAADGKITFNMLDSGQIQFSTTALSGINHAGKLSYSAQALLQS